MSGYYSRKLSAERLDQVYEIAPPRVKQYLDAELNHVLGFIHPQDDVLDQGCGCGRILPQLSGGARMVVGIDTSLDSLLVARSRLKGLPNCHLVCTDASRSGFADGAFDVVVCIQNGISAFHVDQRQLIQESLRITRPGGTALFSSYSDRFWEERLAWFRLQAEAGLLGEIDEDATGDGVIVCKDGFRATTVRQKDFLELTSGIRGKVECTEVDGSSLFCEIRKPPPG